MGFTIEDMNLMAKDRYHMEFIAGKRGWSNSISWVLMMEDTAIIRNFAGKELANLFQLVDTYCHYMIRPEYEGEARLLLLANLEKSHIISVNRPRPAKWEG